MTISSITSYLTHTVDVVAVTISSGSRSTVTTTGIAAFIAQRRSVRRDVGGDHEASETIVYFEPDQSLSLQDEIIIDGKTRPVKKILPARDDTAIRFLRVLVE
jgi:hypothetical protein